MNQAIRFGLYGLLTLVAAVLSPSGRAVAAEDCERAKELYVGASKLLRYEERRAGFHKVVALCPDYAEARVNLGDAYENLGHRAMKEGRTAEAYELWDRAIAEYQQGIAHEGGLLAAHIGLAVTYTASGRYTEAERAFHKARELNPHSTKVLKGLDELRQCMARDHKPFKTEDDIAEVVLMGPEAFTVIKQPVGISFPNILFGPWSHAIDRPAARSQLHEIGKALSSHRLSGYRFVVEGHANSVGLDLPNGFDRLMELSCKRANEVKTYLEQKYDVDGGRVAVTCFGTTRPRFPDDTAEHRELNRRVNVIFVPERKP
jgi:outer membrane protein OmpA-like peptidoglycan-associated protein